jgi:excinuclease ABC subunit C
VPIPAPAFDPTRLLADLPDTPGIYRMLDRAGHPLYVGKARHLQRRVASYFQRAQDQSPRIRAMVRQIHGVECTLTATENEALLLESNLIKELKPRYNIVLRDDKSYPYIHLDTGHPYPALAFHRGGRAARGRYFGPYPSAGAVRETVNLMQKLFQIRNCSEQTFSGRTRPCLQYQIQRCTAPCVGYIAPAAYAEDVAGAVLCLDGRSDEAVAHLVARMEAAAARHDYEQAARDRDRIQALRKIRQSEFATPEGGDADLVVAVSRAGVGCVQIFSVRGGLNLGDKSLFPRHTRDATPAEILAAFLPQYYLAAERVPPAKVLVNHPLPEAEAEWIAAALAERHGRRLEIVHPRRGPWVPCVAQAERNAEFRLAEHLRQGAEQARRWRALLDLLGLPEGLERIECFDISHTAGEAPAASCVVFGAEGALKSEYRRFHIDGIDPGDDYSAMRQAITRRYTRLFKEGLPPPGLLLVDGGKGQVGVAVAALASCAGAGDGAVGDGPGAAIRVVGVAKGPGRRPGEETLILAHGGGDGGRGDGGGGELRPPADSPALHLIQQIRDEAHRFAVRAHRQRRAQARGRSALEGIAGVGRERRRRLIQYFGGLEGVARATVEEISQIPGLSLALAQRIHARMHGE